MRYNVGIWTVRIVLIVLIIFWMTVIFGFSSENGEQSQSFSDRITVRIIEMIEPDYDNLSLTEKKQVFDRTSFCVRKTGHFGEYGILGLLFSGLLVTFKKIRLMEKGRILTVCIAAGICMLYAMTDEFHQSFVDGRSPKVLDVFIDTMGGLTAGIFFAALWFAIDRKRK